MPPLLQRAYSISAIPLLPLTSNCHAPLFFNCLFPPSSFFFLFPPAHRAAAVGVAVRRAFLASLSRTLCLFLPLSLSHFLLFSRIARMLLTRVKRHDDFCFSSSFIVSVALFYDYSPTLSPVTFAPCGVEVILLFPSVAVRRVVFPPGRQPLALY